MSQINYIPLYQKIAAFYRDRIVSQRYKPGSRIDSINKIISRHNISRETAKRVVKILSEEQLVSTIAGKGTFVNVCMESVEKWGVIVPFLSSNIEMLISNIYSEAKLRGRELSYYLHYNNPNEEIRVLGELIQKGYEAVIVVPNYDESYTSEFYRRVFAGNTNIILADNTMAGSYFNYVVQSYDLGVKRAFDYLIKQGEGNFLLINDDRWHGSNLVFELIERTLNTFIQIYSPNSELFVISHMDDLNEDFIKRGGITKVLSIKDSNTIIFIGRLKQWGLYCSDRISIVSYGNTELTKYFSPAITAIDCNYGQMAQEIANLIEDDVSENRQFIIQPKLIIRET